MKRGHSLNRRDFLKISSVAGVGLVISIYLEGCGKPPSPTPTATAQPPTSTLEPVVGPSETPAASPTLSEVVSATPRPPSTAVPTPQNPAAVTPNVYVTIGNDGLIRITVPRSEMGQGTRTSLAMLLAEELCADWNLVRVEQAPGDTAYGNQMTGGSTSIQEFFFTLRLAGATGRVMMINAAAELWGVDPAECYAAYSAVYHQPTGKSLAYWQLVDKAATLEISKQVKAKQPEEFYIIGTSVGRVDNPEIVSGKAIYGQDVRIPGMLYATVARPPVIGGKLASYDGAPALSVPGVQRVVEVDAGIAVVAENTWSAIKGREALSVTWEDGPNAGLNSAQIEQDLLDQANATPANTGELVGVYTFPYYHHATMEPMNCVADVKGDQCNIWVPTQNPQEARNRALKVAKTDLENTHTYVTLVGGGFGRRLEMTFQGVVPAAIDYVTQAVQISKAVETPVQVFWTREDDFNYDIFHPISVYRVSAPLDNISRLKSQRFELRGVVPTGPWRSVTNPPEAFAHESFMDEYAYATGIDPVELRLQTLTGRAKNVVELAASKAGWGTPLPAGQGRGIAYHATWGVSPTAEVVEVAVDNSGNVRLLRIVCAVDCGLVINPDLVVAQMQGGIIFGLTAALKEHAVIENGRPTRNNFDDYPLLRYGETPPIEVYLVNSGQIPTGIGEMANPPVAPALANAIFAATGKRLRRVPFHAEDLR